MSLFSLSGLVSEVAIGGVIAMSYVAAGGSDSFGVVSGTVGHSAAMSDAFAVATWVAAGLAAISGVVAWGASDKRAS